MKCKEGRARPGHCKKRHQLQTISLNSLQLQELKNEFSSHGLSVKVVRIRRKDGSACTRILPAKHFKKTLKTAQVIGPKLGLTLKARHKRPRPCVVPQAKSEWKVVTINICYLKNKVEHVNSLVREVQPDILLIQETHLRNLPQPLKIGDMTIIEVDETETNGENGLVIAVKAELAKFIIVKAKDKNFIIIAVRGEGGESFNLGNIYVPWCFKSRKATAERIVQNLVKYENIALMGDWNMIPDEARNEALKIGCQPYILDRRKPTRRKSAAEEGRRIDYAVSNREGLVIDEKVLDGWKISDHMPVLITIKALKPSGKSSPPVMTVYRSRLADTNVKKALRNVYVRDVSRRDTQAVFDEFYSKIRRVLVKHRVMTSDLKPWSRAPNQAIARLVKRRNEMMPGTEEFNALSKDIREAVRKMHLKERGRQLRKGIEALNSSNPQQAWRWVKREAGLAKGAKLRSTLVDHETGHTLLNDKETAEYVKRHLERLGADSRDEIQTIKTGAKEKNFGKEFIGCLLDQAITSSEVCAALNSCSNGRAAGVDRIPCEVYKEAAAGDENLLRASLKILFNKVMTTGIIPTQWNENTVVMIHKKGSSAEVDNYRGISLINTLSKVFLKILARRLMDLNIQKNFISRNQLGFIEGEEGVSAAMTVCEIAERRRNVGLNTYMLFIDFKKAYDMVPHNILLRKMREVGLGEKFITVFEHLYANTKMRVRVGDELSSAYKLERGVRQGCPSSPMLFNIFIDDILIKMKGISFPGVEDGPAGICFADDTLILAETKEELREKISAIETWVAQNGMEINIAKCGLMVVGNNKVPETFFFNGQEIPISKTYTYLGIEINDEIDYKAMAAKNTAKGYQTLDEAKSMLLNRKMPLLAKKMIIGQVLIPRMAYGMQIFGVNQKNISGAQVILTTALNWAIGKSQSCKSRILEEMNIIGLPERTKLMAMESLRKWSNSKAWAKDCIHNRVYNKKTADLPRKKTWVLLNYESAAKLKIDFNTNSKEEIRSKVLAHFKRLKRYNPDTVANILSGKLKLGSGKAVMKKALGVKTDVYTTISRARCGAIPLYWDFKKNSTVKEEFIGKCLSCGDELKETLEHLLVDCKRFEKARKELLSAVIAYFQKHSPNVWRKKLLSYLLMGRETENIQREMAPAFCTAREYFWTRWILLRQISLKLSTLKG